MKMFCSTGPKALASLMEMYCSLINTVSLTDRTNKFLQRYLFCKSIQNIYDKSPLVFGNRSCLLKHANNRKLRNASLLASRFRALVRGRLNIQGLFISLPKPVGSWELIG